MLQKLFLIAVISPLLFACVTTTTTLPAKVEGSIAVPPSKNVVGDCVSTKESANTPERQFQCKDFKGKTFSATCDLASDPVEFGIGAVQIERAKWAKHGPNEGIEGKFGFIACRKEGTTKK